MLNRYRVGRVLEPTNNDPWFDNILDAIEAADEIARKDYREVVAVWNADSDIEYLFVAAQQFRAL